MVNEAMLARLPRLFLFETVINLFTHGADWKLLGVATWDPFLAAESSDWFASYRRFNNLLFANIVGKSFVIAIFVR